MARLHSIQINNFRGIKSFGYIFPANNLVCFIGRGDSGKSTILDAIASVLSSSWNLQFYDSDFFNCDVSQPIVVEVTLTDLPEYFLKEPLGLQIRGIDSTGKITDDLTDSSKPAITIRLEVKSDLEPKWTLVNARQSESVPISAQARMRLGVFLISDYTDSHFSWTRGNPLQALSTQLQTQSEGNSSILIDALRTAKNQIDGNSFTGLNEIVDQIKLSANELGINISLAATSIDFKDISVRDNRISLHDEKVPFRLKGKGSKRLISIAIQNTLVKSGGVVLIDEIEQGLEPDRTKHLVRSLQSKRNLQVIITTHSQNVVEELDAECIVRLKNNDGIITYVQCDERVQDMMRACPESFYAKKVIVCEGKTEIGICRAIDKYLIQKRQKGLSILDIVYTLGQGTSFTSRAEKLNSLDMPVCVFCDSDEDKKLNPSKDDLASKGIDVFDCQKDNCIEQQIFQDLPWGAVMELINYKVEELGEKSIVSSLNNQLTNKIIAINDLIDSIDSRSALAKVSVRKKLEWFKRIDHGEFLGDVVFKYFDSMVNTHLHNQLNGLLNWIADES